MTVKIDKKSLKNVFSKALCQKGKQKLLESIPLRMEKSGIIFAKIEGDSVAAFGKFGASKFKTYELKRTTDIVVDLMHVSSMNYVKSDPVEIQKKDGKLHFSTNKTKLAVAIQSQEEFNERFWEKNLKMKSIEKNKFPCMSKSLHAEDFDKESDEYSPLLSYLIIETKELSNIPDCDSIILRGDEDGVYLETIDFGGGVADYESTLTPKYYEYENDSFSVRIDKSYWDLVLGQFSALVNITVAMKYVMFMESKKGEFYGYMIGTIGEKAETMGKNFIEEIEELDDLEDVETDLESTIDEVTETEDDEDIEILDTEEDE